MARKTKTLGEVLRSKREAAGLSLRGLTEVSGVDAAWIHRLENDQGQPSDDVLRKLGRALNLRLEDLQARANRQLPRLAPYLRAKYDLDDEAVAELERHFETVRKRGRS